MRISVLAYDGCLGFEIFGLTDVLLLANRISDAGAKKRPPPFAVEIIGVGVEMVTLAGGARLSVARATTRADLLVVPAFDVGSGADFDKAFARLASEIAFVRRAAAKRPVAAICGGAFLLAAAGLLDERRATTAWAFAGEFARRFPAVRLEPEALIVRDGNIVTSGAVSACVDLALQIVRENAGPGLARAVGKIGLFEAGRGSQAPYFDARFAAKAHERFSDSVTRWMEARLADRYSLERLASAFNTSERTLLRRFKGETKSTPLRRLQQLRVTRAKQLLEETGMELVNIAEEVGYRDLSAFSRLFVREARITPAAYRRRFRPNPDVPLMERDSL